MSTYNGEKYLEEQIESVLAQENVNIKIIVRDDGSTDNTIKILKSYAKRNLLSWYAGSNIKPARSFLELLKNAPESDYYAFCDQDDYWMSDKLSVALEKIDNQQKPALYCSDTLLVNSNLDIISKGNIKAEGTFTESLVSNPVTGCTMVLNNDLRKIILKYNPKYIDMHDWWIYRICTAINGYFYFDTTSHIKYRQHGNNVVGGISSYKNKLKRRLSQIVYHTEGARYRMATELYKGYYDEISLDKKRILDLIIPYKKSIIKTIKLAFNKQLKLNNKTTISLFRKAVLLRQY